LSLGRFGDYAIGLELLARAGTPTMQAVQAATRAAADAIGLGNIVATVEVGNEADLTIVRGDPLADIRCLNEVAMVMRADQVFSAAGGSARVA